MFEYPRKSGNWYTGKHEAIVTKELFELVQAQIKSNVLRIENKEFAFTKMMTCGLCGSGISADEKFKKHPSNGTVRRYVYYGCTKAKDGNCKCGYTEEKEILKQFEALIETININEIQIKEKIKVDVEKFTKLQKFLLGTKEKINIPSIDVRGYAKYVLREGSITEKRELLGHLRSRLLLEDKKITLVKEQ